MAGSFKSLRGLFPVLQIITVADIFDDKPLKIPGRINPVEPKRSASVEAPIAEQLRLLPWKQPLLKTFKLQNACAR